MLLFDLEDATGKIAVIAWNDTYDKYAGLFKNDSTYTLCNVRAAAKKNNNELEIKLYADTPVHNAIPLKLEDRTLGDLLAQPGIPVRAKVIVYNVGEVETMSSTGKMRRCCFVDESGDIAGFIVGDDAVSKHIVDGTTVRIVGRMTQKTNIFADSIEVIDDDKLTTFWSASSATHLAKRAKLTNAVTATIADLTTTDVGSFVKLTGVVRNSRANPMIIKDRIKHECTLVDRTMHAIALAQFCDKDTPCAWKIGDVIRVDAKVSSFDTKSLTCNSVNVIEDADMSSWFEEFKSAVFTELTQGVQQAPSAVHP